MKIYTKTGDDGTTGLFGGGRLSKASPRIEAYGTVDELNSIIGHAATIAMYPIHAILSRIQIDLFVLGADLATPQETKSNYAIPRIEQEEVDRLERTIDEQTEELPELRKFILPGGSDLAARLHVARTVCRRAERLLVHLESVQTMGHHDIVYLNRLSDLLFVLARRANQLSGVPDIEWDGKKPQ